MTYKFISLTLIGSFLSLGLITKRPAHASQQPAKAKAKTQAPKTITPDQSKRKAASEALLKEHDVKVNPALPFTKSEAATTLRSSKEVAQRVVVLAAINLVAYGNFTAQQISDYLKRYNLWEHTTPKEKAFLQNPTQDAMNNETWKAEDIWTLMWSLRLVADLKFPEKPASLNDILPDNYPFKGLNNDPKGFIANMTRLRDKADILNAADLYYRLDWACADAQNTNRQMNKVSAPAIYERHYALNWLINHKNQAWDDVTCDL